MALKKRNIPSSSSSASSSSEEAEALCKRAIELQLQGHVTKAHRILSDARHRLDSSPIFHHYRGFILHAYALLSHANNPETKKQLFQEALESERRATQLSPANLNFSVFYVRFLTHLSEDGELFEAAWKECERALAVINPVSFDLKRFKVPGEGDFQEELRFLLDVLKNPTLSMQDKKMLAMNQQLCQVRKYLKALAAADWRGHLRVEAEFFKNPSLSMEAMIFAKANHTWRYWFCPRCKEKFGDSESQLQHVLKDHVGNLSEELKPYLPEEINQDWVNKLVNSKWEPIDADAAMDLFQADPDCEEWPFCDDTERRKLLLTIHACLTLLVKYKYLSMSSLDKVLSYAMKEVQALAPGSALLKNEVDDRSVICIQLLDSSKLQKILKFLKCLLQSCKLGRYADFGSPDDDDDDAFLDNPKPDERIRAILDPSLLYIDLDLKITDCNNTDDSCPDDDEIMHVLCWFDENSITEQIGAWFQQRESRKQLADKIIRKLEKEFQDLRLMSTEKRELFNSQGHLRYVESICKKELVTSFELILKKRKEELAERAEKGDELGMNVISDVFRTAEASKASHATTKSDSINDDDTKMSAFDNSSITVAFQTLEESLDEKLGIVDAKMMKNLSTTRKLMLNLALTSAFDYLAAIAPLLKLSVKDGIKKAVEENAKRKSEGAKEVSLAAELPCDREKTTDKRDSQTSSTSKKKKSRNSRKSKGRWV